MFEVAGLERLLLDFLEDRHKVVQGADRQRRARREGPACSAEDEGGADEVERHPSSLELSGQAAIERAGPIGRVGQEAAEAEDLRDVSSPRRRGGAGHGRHGNNGARRCTRAPGSSLTRAQGD